MVDTSGFTRRTALGFIGGGTILAVSETFGFSNVTGSRGLNIGTTTDPDALIGLLIADQVKKNNQELLVEVTNNTNEPLDGTVTLEDCTHGTLYSSDGGSGCSVDLSLKASGSSGDTGTVDIEAPNDGITVPFTITATSATLSFEADRETEVVSGNAESAVEVMKPKQFRANENDNNWTIGEVEAVSNDGNHQLEKVEYEVRSNGGAGNVVGTLEESASGDQYLRSGNPAIVITPDGNHQIAKHNQYELTITAYDDAGNFGSRTETVKA